MVKRFFKDKEREFFYVTDEDNKVIKTVNFTRKDCVIYIYYKEGEVSLPRVEEITKELYSHILKRKLERLNKHKQKYYEKTDYHSYDKSYVKTKVKWDIPKEIVVLDKYIEKSPQEPISMRDRLEDIKTFIISKYNKLQDLIED